MRGRVPPPIFHGVHPGFAPIFGVPPMIAQNNPMVNYSYSRTQPRPPRMNRPIIDPSSFVQVQQNVVPQNQSQSLPVVQNQVPITNDEDFPSLLP